MELLKELNQEQLAAATHIEGPLLVLAGAGSGKTRVVAYRIAYLIEQGVSPSQIVAVTFTNKAAREMQERIQTLLKGVATPLICTFHSLGVRILRESIHHLGFSPNFTIYDEEDASKLLRLCMQALNIKKEGEFKTFRGAISAAKNELQDPSDIDVSTLSETAQAVVAELYKLYQERLREANALDFDDLLFLTVTLFQKHPDVLRLYQNRWPYLLIDEYQDTNRAQYLMARLIVGEKKNLFVVGDPDQSIYSWRGANIQNILNFEKDYPGARVVRLEQNYRSRKTILEAANKLIKNNYSRYEKNLWSLKGEGEKIQLFIADNEREEASFVVHEIEKLHTFYAIPYSEMCIFYRTNFQSRIFEDFLLRKRIAYTIVGGISFYHRKEIKDILAYLRLVSSDCDTVSFERAINLPKRGIGLASLEKIRFQAAEKQVPLLSYCARLIQNPEVRLSAKQKEGLKEFIEIITSLRAVRQEGSLQKLVVETIRQSRYLDVLREDKESYDDRKQNIDELVSKAHEWQLINDSDSLELFLEELCLKSSLDEASFGEETLNLMTLHNGKGLEFEAAFLVGMEEDLFPHVNSRNSHDALEEERRLCYVGMTRAKERLYLTAARSRFIWGIHRMMRPSRFLSEIPKTHTEKII